MNKLMDMEATGLQEPSWVCQDCGTEYYNVVHPGGLVFCPHCKAKKDRAEQQYWDNKLASMRSVASLIVNQILANKI